MCVGVVLGAPVVAGWEGVLEAEPGGGPKADRVIDPGCDPPDPSVDGCPNAGVCCGLPNADGES